MPPILAERTAYTHQFHTEQGWRKGAERFGELVGLGAEQQLAVRVAVLEADATHLRMQSKAALSLLAEAQATYEEAVAQLNASQGEMDFLSQLRERACTLAEIAAEEEEAELEAEVLRGTLESYAGRAAEALHLRLAWHSKAGAQKAGEALHAPNLAELDAAVADAKRDADAAEPIRREEGVLRGKLSRSCSASGARSASCARRRRRASTARRSARARRSSYSARTQPTSATR